MIVIFGRCCKVSYIVLAKRLVANCPITKGRLKRTKIIDFIGRKLRSRVSPPGIFLGGLANVETNTTPLRLDGCDAAISTAKGVEKDSAAMK